MARVASCPQCSHEILILDDGNSDAWAKCPECRAFFQVKQASAREIRPAALIDEPSAASGVETAAAEETVLDPFGGKAEATLSASSDATIAGFQPAAEQAQHQGDAAAGNVEAAPEPVTAATAPLDATAVVPADVSPAESSSATVSDLPNRATWSDDTRATVENAGGSEATPPDAPAPSAAAERAEESTDRIDKWFRAAKSSADAPPPMPRASDAPRESEAVGAAPEEATVQPNDRATWDDSDRMERLLSNIDSPANAEQAEPEADGETSDERPQEFDPLGQLMTEQPAGAFIPPGRLARRHRSLTRTLITSVVSGVIGLAIGYYVLMLILGPAGDFLNVARHLPGAILPAEFQLEATPLARVDQSEQQAAGEHTVATPSNGGASPAEMQASYAAALPHDGPNRTEASEPNGVRRDANQPGGQQPLPFDAPPAIPLDGPQEAVAGQLVQPPAFTADELAVALRTAQDAQPKLVAGKLDDGREVQRAKGFGYSLLCDLAQKAIFVDTATRADYAQALALDAERLFRQTLADAHTRDEVARILPKWISSPHRKQGGVFFAGTVTRQTNKGALVECEVDAAGHGTMIVLVPLEQAKPLADAAGPVGVVGWIVDEPALRVNGYTGAARQAIWAGRLIALQ